MSYARLLVRADTDRFIARIRATEWFINSRRETAGYELSFQAVRCNAPGMITSLFYFGFRDANRPWNVVSGSDIWDTLLTFRVTSYPNCCGLVLFHNFVVPYGLPEEINTILSELLEALLEPNSRQGYGSLLGGNKHLELMMVNAGYKGAMGRKSNRSAPPADALEKNMDYQFFLDFFKARAKQVDVHPGYWNKNSANLMHRVDVCF